MRIVDEGFEGTGYEESWAETVSGGNTLDEDSTTIACLGLQSLKAIATSVAAPSAFAVRTFNNVNSVYTRAWVYVSQNGLTVASETANIIAIPNSASTSAARIQLRNNAGTFQMRFIYYSNGGDVNVSGVNVSINTWYLVEFSYDINIMKWSWFLNGALKGIGNLVGNVLTPNKVVVGIAGHTGTAQSTVHIDGVIIDTEHYLSLVDFSDPIILEVPSTTILFTSRLYIKSIRWVDATTAGHTAVLAGKGGRTFWASEASGDNFVDSFLYEGWVEGLQIPTLASGKIYLQIG